MVIWRSVSLPSTHTIRAQIPLATEFLCIVKKEAGFGPLKNFGPPINNCQPDDVILSNLLQETQE